MANKHENLISLFTNIAEAIREKSGGSAAIVADEFPDAIRAIDTSEDLNAELAAQEEIIAAQDTLITNMMTALEGKAAGGSDKITKTIYLDWSGDTEQICWIEYISNNKLTKAHSHSTEIIEAEYGIVYYGAASDTYTSDNFIFIGDVYVATQDGETIYFVSSEQQ